MFLQNSTKLLRDFRLHRLNHALDVFLVVGVLRNEAVLEFHNRLNDELQLINFGFFLAWKNVVLFEDLANNLVQLKEGVRKVGFNARDTHDTSLL